MLRIQTVLFLLISLLLGGCLLWGESGIRLAKVKDHTLTLEELKADGVVGRDSVMSRVLLWVDKEVQVQEAREMGLHLEPRIVWLLRDAERKILLDAYYARIHAEVSQPEEGELESHYDHHKTEYMRNETWLKIQLDTLVPIEAPTKVQAILEGPRSTLPSCLLGSVDTLNAGDTSSVPCGDYQLRVLLQEKRPQGGAMPFAEAHQRILNEVYAIRKQRHTDSLLVLAKVRHTVYTWPENLPTKENP